MSRKIFTSFMTILMVVCMLMPIAVFADSYPLSTSTAKQVSLRNVGISTSDLKNRISDPDIWDDTNNTLYFNYKGDKYELIQIDGNTLYVNTMAFKKGPSTQITKTMRTFIDALGEMNLNNDSLQQIMTDIQETDSSVSTIMLPLIFQETKGDMYAAYKITSPFLNILSIVLGVGAVIIIVFTLFSTVMDLVYIGLPVWRNSQSDKGKKNPFGVSYEAMRTVEEVEGNTGGGSTGEYKNAYLLYLRRRALTYIILAICIMYLITGGLSGIIGFVLQLVSGITG